jgi:predicted DNA-binding protein (UPF0251 family)/phage FluMu protein Com
VSPRRKRFRRVGSPPALKGFKPFGIPFSQTGVVSLHFEEYEALQLADYKKLSQEDAAKIMNVSRPTFTRIYDSCLKKVARAFVEGLSITIEGGDVQFEKEWFRCNQCNHVFSKLKTDGIKCPKCKSDNLEHINESIRNWREEQYSSSASATSGYCICPQCHHKEPHRRGVPCYSINCPECGSTMTRNRGE